MKDNHRLWCQVIFHCLHFLKEFHYILSLKYLVWSFLCEPTNIDLYFLIFRIISLFSHHILKVAISSLSLSHISSTEFEEYLKVVSSAYKSGFVWFSWSGRSSIYKRNNKGSRILPCGTPNVTFFFWRYVVYFLLFETCLINMIWTIQKKENQTYTFLILIIKLSDLRYLYRRLCGMAFAHCGGQYSDL